MKITENDLKQAEEFTAFINKVIIDVWHKSFIKVDKEEWGKISKFSFPEEKEPYLGDYQREIKAALARWENNDNE